MNNFVNGNMHHNSYYIVSTNWLLFSRQLFNIILEIKKKEANNFFLLVNTSFHQSIFSEIEREDVIALTIP